MKKFIYVLLAVIAISLTGCEEKKVEEPVVKTDAVKFKESYESLNNTTRESDGAKYNNVSISEENPIKYVSVSEATKLLDSDSAIIYVGANWCPWCRNAVPVMLDVAKSLNVKTINYLELDNDKSMMELKDGKVEVTRKGTDAYYELLKKLDKYLDEYTLTDKDGKEYKTGEKRIYMPYLIAVKDGEVKEQSLIVSTLNDNQTKYDKITDEQKTKLEKTISKIFKAAQDDTSCSTEEKCG